VTSQSPPTQGSGALEYGSHVRCRYETFHTHRPRRGHIYLTAPAPHGTFSAHGDVISAGLENRISGRRSCTARPPTSPEYRRAARSSRRGRVSCCCSSRGREVRRCESAEPPGLVISRHPRVGDVPRFASFVRRLMPRGSPSPPSRIFRARPAVDLVKEGVTSRSARAARR